jgi:hypothetical protein
MLAQEALALRVAACGTGKRLHEAPGPFGRGLCGSDRTVPLTDRAAQLVQQARWEVWSFDLLLRPVCDPPSI